MSDQFPAVYYVRPDGSDQNDGSSDVPGSAFLTIQRAVEVALATPSPTSVVTIHVAHGSYSRGIVIAGPVPAKADVKYGYGLHLVGDKGRPEKVELDVVGSDAVRVSDGASILITGMTLRTRESGNLVTATRRATVGHRYCVFGSAASETISASRYAEVYAIGPTTVSGSSLVFAHATTRSTISFSTQTITFLPGLHFSRYLWAINDATIRVDKSRIIGRATGDIAVHVNGVLNVASLQGEWRGGAEPRVFEGGIIALGKGAATYVAPAWERVSKGREKQDTAAEKLQPPRS